MLYNKSDNGTTQAIVSKSQGESEEAPRRFPQARAHPPRIGRGALQEVRETRVPLRQGQRARASVLPLRYARRRKDTILLSPSEAQENSWRLPTQFQEASRAHRAARRDQSRAARARRSRFAGVVRAGRKPARVPCRVWGIASPARVQILTVWPESCGRSWRPCFWSSF